MNTLSSFKPSILFKTLSCKKYFTIASIFITACILSVSSVRIIHANNNSTLYKCSEYSVDIPNGFTVDAETDRKSVV